LIDHVVLVARCRRDAQALGALGYRRIVDRLDVDAVLAEQEVARGLAFRRVADRDGWAVRKLEEAADRFDNVKEDG
jgi:hypothetical protein